MSLQTQDLGVYLGDRWLFRHLALDVQPGALTVVVGPNGAGKSTLLRTLAGLAPPTAGTILYKGSDLTGIPGRDRARAIAYLPQDTPLYHDLRAREVVMLGRLPHLQRLRPPGRKDEDRVTQSLEDVGADDLADRRLSTLSGGERQRVMLARMLATEAPLLLLDEPTAALDIGHALRLLAMLRDLASQRRSVVLALHDLDLADRFATEAVCLHGDDDGSFAAGPRPDVLKPDALARVFNVEVTRNPEGHLHVDLPR